MPSCQNVQESEFQSQFSMLRIIWIFIFSLKNIILCRSTIFFFKFFDNINFITLCWANFWRRRIDTISLHKIQSVHEVCYASITWKLDSLYILPLWQYWLWSLQGRDTKLESFMAKNQLWSNEIIEFCALL